jgi:hypothetical protein
MATPIDAFNSTTYQFSYNQVFKSPDNFCEEYLFGLSPTVCEDPDFEDANYFDGNDSFHALSWNQAPGTILSHEYQEYLTSEFNTCSELNNYFDTQHRLAPHLKLDEDSVYLKLIINVTYKGNHNDGSPLDYTYMFTYKIDSADIAIDTINPIDPYLFVGSPDHINQYPEYLFLDGESFNGQPVEGCQLNGSTYLCKAIEEAELTGTFTVANGYNVIVEAGNEVRVTPEAITPPEMVWQIVPVWDYSNPMPPVDNDYVKAFCSETGLYAASSGTKSLLEADSLATGEEEEDLVNQPSIFDFTLYPNPTNGRTTARIALEENAIGDLYITDLNGRKLSSAFENERIRKGENEYVMPTNQLSSGIYLVHLFVNGEHHVKRLVKQ